MWACHMLPQILYNSAAFLALTCVSVVTHKMRVSAWSVPANSTAKQSIMLFSALRFSIPPPECATNCAKNGGNPQLNSDWNCLRHGIWVMRPVFGCLCPPKVCSNVCLNVKCFSTKIIQYTFKIQNTFKILNKTRTRYLFWPKCGKYIWRWWKQIIFF